ncbi:MAG: hypothetical protein K6F99_07665 [Lachnospiraceae bacterium]|nr:hypothetical protein [Lachnospiraceae bacterium]
MERNEAFLQREYRRALGPVMVAVLAGTVNTLIDTAFVSRRLDYKALAAVNLNMPVFLLLCMVGSMIGVGAFTVVSRALGKRREDLAVMFYHSALILSVIFGVLFMIAGAGLSDIISVFLCKDAELLPMVRAYCRVTLFGAAPYILIYIPTFFLRISGKSKEMSIMMYIMIITDVFFDWLLLYVFDLGVVGAGLASVLSMLIACVYGFWMLQDKNSLFRFDKTKLRVYGLKEIVMFGSSTALDTLMGVLRMLVLNWIIYHAGGVSALAVWAVINSILELSICITGGVPRTAAPLLGIFGTGQDNEGMRMIVKYEIKVGILLSAIFSAAIIIFYRPIGNFFKIKESLLIPFICLGISLLFGVVVSILGSYYNVTNHIILSNFVMITRTFIFAVIFAGLLLIGGENIWLFMPLSMIVTLGVIYLAAKKISNDSKGKAHELSSILLLDDYLEKNKKVKVFSITSSDESICKASEDISDFCMEQNMDRKTVMKLGLALEEVLTVMAHRALKNENDPVDIRIYSIDDEIGITIMCSGNRYNPFQVAAESDDELDMGVQMINRLAKECHYTFTLNMNILTVGF